MVVFTYDKTIEGLLTAVFYAYEWKTFPDKLIGEDEPHPMFTTEHYHIVTDSARSARVWNGLVKKLPKKACNMLMHLWLSEEDGTDMLFFRYIRKVFDSPGDVYMDFTDPDILDAKQIAKKVSCEARYLIQFVRFQKASDGTFFAPVSPRYNVLPLILYYFKDRFADQKWMLYDTKRGYGYYYDMKNIVEITLTDQDFMEGGRLDEKFLAEDEKTFQQMWRSYFKALTIKERLNPKVQRQNMPRRFWKYLTEMQEE
ncbi:MAG: TIGR03915 family putative DNA repair protein [Rikenellaceae bacterium]|nr:TIGR03915 family putative DNA repair protein [Rikenellaceae bacterium]